MPVSKIEEDILVKEIGKLGGFFGGFGARIAARRLSTEEHEMPIQIHVDAVEARAITSRVLKNLRARADSMLDSSEMTGGISAIVGSGHMNLNPTIVRIQFCEASASTTIVLVRTLAKEGLIKQNSAEKAAERIKNLLLNNNCGSS